MRSCLIVVGLVACALFAVVQADCTAGNSCASCTAIHGCGWCTATQTCTPGAPLGPANGTCVGDYWVWGAGNCVDCGALTDCRQCMIWNQDCFWCINQASCLAIGTGLGCQQASSCPCDIYSRCSDCNYDAGCFWCNSNDTCQNQNTACNMPAHTPALARRIKTAALAWEMIDATGAMTHRCARIGVILAPPPATAPTFARPTGTHAPAVTTLMAVCGVPIR